MMKKHGSNDDKFVYKGRVELVDLEVAAGSALEDERRFKVPVPKAVLLRMLVCFLFFKKEIDVHFSHRDDWTFVNWEPRLNYLFLYVTNLNSPA